MGYRTLDLSRGSSRLTETIGVTDKVVSFNRAVSAKMGITPESKVSVLVDDNDFLAIAVLDKDSPTGRRLCGQAKNGTRFLVCTKLIKCLTPGRYHITGRDGAFWLTDIKYEEK